MDYTIDSEVLGTAYGNYLNTDIETSQDNNVIYGTYNNIRDKANSNYSFLIGSWNNIEIQNNLIDSGTTKDSDFVYGTRDKIELKNNGGNTSTSFDILATNSVSLIIDDPFATVQTAWGIGLFIDVSEGDVTNILECFNLDVDVFGNANITGDVRLLSMSLSETENGSISGDAYMIYSEDDYPSFFRGDIELGDDNGFKAVFTNSETQSADTVLTLPNISGTLALVSDTLSDAPADGSQYARQNNAWTVIQSAQRVINSTDTIQATLNNNEYELNAIGSANYSEWATYFETGIKRLVIGFNTTTISIIDSLTTIIESPSLIINTPQLTLGNSVNLCTTTFNGDLNVKFGDFQVGEPLQTPRRSKFYGNIELREDSFLRFYRSNGGILNLVYNDDAATQDIFLPNTNGTLAVLEQVVEEAPSNGSIYVRQNKSWVLIPSGGQTVINSTDTVQATTNNNEYELNAIGSANYSEWAQYFGTRGGGNLNVQIGDYDSFNNNTYIEIVDSTGFIDLNATQGKVNLNAPLITALGNLEMFFTDLQFRGSGTTTITKTGSSTNTLTLPTSSGTFALTSQLLGDAPADSQQYARQNGAWTVINIPPSGSPEGYFIDGVGSYNNETISIGDGAFTFNTASVTIGSGIDLYAPNSFVSINTQTAGANAQLTANTLSQDRFQALPDKDGTFAMLSDIVTGIGEAPNDGKQYARQNESWQVVITGGGYQFITENIDVSNDFAITIGDFNTSGIEVQNQSGFNYIQLGNFNFDARVDISTTDVRIGDQFGLGTGTLFQMFSSSIAINAQSGLRLESGFNTQGVNLKLNAIAANNKYDCFFPQKTGNQTIAMISDLDAVGAQSKSFTITDPINEVIPLFVLGDSISITNIVVSRLGANDLQYKLGYGNTLDAIDQNIGSTETVNSNGANVISIIEGVPANNFLFLDIIDNGGAAQFHITINYE